MKNISFESKQKKKIAPYIEAIENPSIDFKYMYNQYFINQMGCFRNEEDRSVWQRLKDKELSIAKQMILDNLHDSGAACAAYIRAIGVFRDERGIDLLKNFLEINKDNKKLSYGKLVAGNVLYNWIDYPEYIELLENILPNSKEYTKASLYEFIFGLDRDLAERYIFMMLKDKSGFVRCSALTTFKVYYKISDEIISHYDNTSYIYFVGDDVYCNKELFEQRLYELKQLIKTKG